MSRMMVVKYLCHNTTDIRHCHGTCRNRWLLPPLRPNRAAYGVAASVPGVASEIQTML